MKAFREVDYWEQLNYELPQHIYDVLVRRETYRVQRENVQLVVREYNRFLCFAVFLFLFYFSEFLLFFCMLFFKYVFCCCFFYKYFNVVFLYLFSTFYITFNWIHINRLSPLNIKNNFIATSRILSLLTLSERGLFRERIMFLDRKVLPGLTKITWSQSQLAEQFLQECRTNTIKVNLILSFLFF